MSRNLIITISTPSNEVPLTSRRLCKGRNRDQPKNLSPVRAFAPSANRMGATVPLRQILPRMLRLACPTLPLVTEALSIAAMPYSAAYWRVFFPAPGAKTRRPRAYPASMRRWPAWSTARPLRPGSRHRSSPGTRRPETSQNLALPREAIPAGGPWARRDAPAAHRAQP